MSDSPQPPPTRSKPGSLRDRIAAFEKTGPSSSAPKPPPVRAKPVAWKPAPHSPPSNATETTEQEERKSVGGMSASDAKESIGKGGSLKDRMAALQGKGAFGGGVAPGPPPIGPKPVKRPPLVVPPPPKEESGEQATETEEQKLHGERESSGQPPESGARDDTSIAPIGAGEDVPKGDLGEPVEEGQDEEAKERERRAAIAARMARLGGARVGLAPPVFGKKPVAPSQETVPSATLGNMVPSQGHGSELSSELTVQPKVETPPAVNNVPETVADDVATAEEIQVAPLPPPHLLPSPSAALDIPPIMDSESHPNADASASHSLHASVRAPLPSMPIPAAPRRAGPPRKKSARNLKAEEKVQDKETPQVPLAPAEAPAEPFDDAPSLMQQEPLPPVGPGAGSEHEEQELSVQHSASDTHEAVFEQDSNPLPGEGSRISAPESVEITDEAKHPEAAIHEAPHELAIDIVGETETDDTNVPRSEIETHTSTVDAPTTQGMLNMTDMTDAYNSHEPSASVVDEPEVSEPSKSDILSPVVQPADMDSTMSPVGQHSEPNLKSEPNASTTAVPADEPAELPSEETETGVPEPEPKVPTILQDQTEEEETDRRKRIAERLAKMGGRNPFSASPLGALGPSSKGSGDEPHEVDHVLSHEESPVEESKHEDAAQEGGDLAEPAIEVEGHGREATSHEPRVSSAAEDQHRDVTAVEGSVEENEAVHPEHPLLLFQPEPETQLEIVPPEQEDLPSSPEVNEMAPPRITRAIPPPPPPPASVENPNAMFQRQPVSLVPELSPVTQEPVAVVDDEIEINTSQDGNHDQVSIALSDPMCSSLPSVKAVPRGIERTSPSPTSSRSVPSPSPITPIASPPIDSTKFRSPPSPSSRRSIPPLPRTVSTPTDSTRLLGESSPLSSPTSPQRAVPVPARPSVPQVARSSSSEAPSPPTPTKPRPTSVRRSIPPPSPSIPPQINDVVAPPPPRRIPSQPVEEVIPSIIRRGSTSDASEQTDALSQATTVGLEIQTILRESFEEQEILAESEPDPIDPAFYSPPRSPANREQDPPSFASNSREASETNAADNAEQTRRRTIAERMAKLGGIRFGAPPIPRKISEPLPESPSTHEPDPDDREPDLDTEDTTNKAEVESEEPDSEEAERVRRQAIAARLAGLGGMRFGMLPQMSTSKPPLGGFNQKAAQTAEQSSVLPQPPAHGAPSLSVEAAAIEADSESVSDEGVKIEAGSELSMEEVNPEEAEEVPPPIPSRPSRPPHPPSSDTPPPLPGGRRPPVPVSAPTRPPVPKTESKRPNVFDPVRKASGSSAHHVPSSSDFVMVEENQEFPPPPPPPRSRPSRSPPPPAASRGLDNSSWELPEIPRGSFDINTLSMDASISLEDSTTYPAPSAPQVPPPHHVEPTSAPAPAPVVRADVQLSADDLLQLWGSVGTAVHAAASALFDKSKKSIVGDGTSQGFVNAALAQVPQASKASYGHLIYSQNGNSVLRRSSTIMPGDIIQLTEAKLKGHKGLQSYHQTAGTVKDPLVAIVSEFDVKKSKVKVLQANQHVGSQTVEAASYRLDDLKSGSVKVFRVATVK